jgi:hypothetical protein
VDGKMNLFATLAKTVGRKILPLSYGHWRGKLWYSHPQECLILESEVAVLGQCGRNPWRISSVKTYRKDETKARKYIHVDLPVCPSYLN